MTTHAPQLSAADSLAIRQKPAPCPLLANSVRPTGSSRYQRITVSSAFRCTVVPGGLLTLAVLSTRKVNVLAIDEPLRREVQARTHIRAEIEDQLRHIPAYATIGLSLAGIKGRHSTLNQALLFGLAYTFNNAASGSLKRLTRVERLQDNSFDSFPSLHTSTAFSSARVLDKEYGGRSGWYSVGDYTMAAITGGLHIANDDHWLSDMLAGACSPPNWLTGCFRGCTANWCAASATGPWCCQCT